MTRIPFTPRPLDRDDLKIAFSGGTPFRHVVIDDFFDSNDALTLHRAFPRFSKIEELKTLLFAGRAYGAPPSLQVTPFRMVCSALASRTFVETVSEISGIRQLALDETLSGAGPHIGLRGSSLPIHADHNTHPSASWLFRRLNLLVYLNPRWEAGWRSNLLLYDHLGRGKVGEIEPRFNRAILMEVHDRAFHGYLPLKMPSGESRQALAMYFYALEPAAEQSSVAHPTILAVPSSLNLKQKVVAKAQRSLLRRVRQLAPKPDWNYSRIPSSKE